MTKKWEEALDSLNAKLDELGSKANEAAEAAKEARQERTDAVDEKISDAKSDIIAAKEQAREAAERGKSKLNSEMLKAQMTFEAKVQDLRDAHDKKKLERYIEDQIENAVEYHDAALYMIGSAKLAVLEALSAAAEYEERFGAEE